MSKADKRLIQSMKEAVAIINGEADPSTYVVHSRGPEPNVMAIRLRLGLSQAKFAARFGFPLDTLRKWEQHQREPTGAARVLLTVIDKNPQAVIDALESV
ncbi:MAG TPA: helix-turn-helix domain-containing protein [Alphaproteobacteria bacterium]|nr:helix-turn-helix domain-containing protein [Alphaproteobacteria bacterium]